MGTIAEKLTYLENTKEAIKDAIILKGVSVTDVDSFRSYASKISLISGGGITPTGTINITSNGSNINVNNYASANVSVKYAPTNHIQFGNIEFEPDTRTNYDYETANLDTSNLTDLDYMFSLCKSVTSLNLSSWNTSNITSMKGTFRGCQHLANVNVNGWNTSNVTDMSFMFEGSWGIPRLEDLTTLNLSSFTSESLLDVSQMFKGCFNLAHLDIRGLELSSIVSLSYNDMLYQVPTNCEIIVKDATEKAWFNTNFASYINVLTVAEYEAL